MSKELKPCPFCGGENIYKDNDYMGNFSHYYCGRCGIRTSDNTKEIEQEAIEAWNTRPKGTLVERDKVLKIVNKHFNFDFEEQELYISANVVDEIKNLPTVEAQGCDFKIGDFLYGINEYEEIIEGDLAEHEDYFTRKKELVLVNEGIIHYCNEAFYKTRAEAEAKLEALQGLEVGE